jgi:hypothetical protein
VALVGRCVRAPTARPEYGTTAALGNARRVASTSCGVEPSASAVGLPETLDAPTHLDDPGERVSEDVGEDLPSFATSSVVTSVVTLSGC